MAGTDTDLVTDIRSAYEDGAEGWASGPAALYRLLADALIATAPEQLAGRRVLDLGAGTGVATEALTAADARPVAVDLAHAMLAHRQAQRPPGVVGDAQALPFHAGVFDAVVAAFSLNHVPDLHAALSQCRRVTRSGGWILASTFPTSADHPAKAVVESVLAEFGYQRPAWYTTFKARIAELTGDAQAFAHAATAAGLRDVRVDVIEIDAGLDDPERAVAWRLNMPHTIGFVADLDAATRAALHARARAALPATLPPTVPMLALRAHVDGDSNGWSE